MQSIIQWDKALFRLINYKWHNDFFDWLMPFLRNQELWYPLYFFLLIFVVVNYKKKGWWWVLFAAATIITANFISSDIVKNNIYRLRPCNDPVLSGWIRVLVGYRPQSSSFTSSHAANHFGMAVFFYLTLRPYIHKWLPVIFFIWAFAICYAQVYVGVHYPLDTAGGAFIGIVIGYLYAKLFNSKFGLL